MAVNRQKGARVLAAAKYLVFVALPVVLLVALIFLASHVVQTLFPVRSVVITGNEHLTDDELKSMAGISSG